MAARRVSTGAAGKLLGALWLTALLFFTPAARALAGSETRLGFPVDRDPNLTAAFNLFHRARGMADGPKQDEVWRQTAERYRTALELGPALDQAPEAAMNGAYAYKQIGEYAEAIAVYQLFIAEYGAEARLKDIEKGTLDAAAQPEKLAARVKFLKHAHDALAGSYILSFSYQSAADTFAAIASYKRFDSQHRRRSARQAVLFYTRLGNDAAARKSMRTLFQLGASPKERAEAGFILAKATLNRWDEFSPDKGANRAARRRAQQAMKHYLYRFQGKDAAARYGVAAAYHLTKLRAAAGRTHLRYSRKAVTRAFEKWKRLAPLKSGANSALGSREADMAAEAALAQIDDDLEKKFDHRQRRGTKNVVVLYESDTREAAVWFKKLQQVIDIYGSPRWTMVAQARQGALYDDLRRGLSSTSSATTTLFHKQISRMLTAFEKAAVRSYSMSVVSSRRHNLTHPAVVSALRRLAFLTEVVGEANMKAYTSDAEHLRYRSGQFLRIRPGLTSTPEASGMPPPLLSKASH